MNWKPYQTPTNHSLFLKLADRMKKPDLKSRLAPHTPWVCFSNEFGVSDLSAAGGLGYLAGDWVLLAGKLGIPFVGIGLYYQYKWHQAIDKNFWQVEKFYKTDYPGRYKFNKLGNDENFSIPKLVINGLPVEIEVFAKNIKGNSLFMLFEPGIRSLYEGIREAEHRLYQSSILGFAGILVLERLGITPSILHLNESSTVIAALSWLDRLCQSGSDFESALETVASKTIFTNHTLSPAAEPDWSLNQIKSYVLGNIKNEEVKTWLTDVIKEEGGRVRLSNLAMRLAGRINGVSKLHAEKATQTYGKKFTPITNAIANRWIYPDILDKYRNLKIIDPFTNIIKTDYKTRLETLNLERMIKIKKRLKQSLYQYLRAKRIDQYGKRIKIPTEAKIIFWARRFDLYKRPDLLFDQPEHLTQILDNNNFHILLAGRPHQTDNLMKKTMQKILRLVDDSPVLKQRVHFIIDYDRELARHFAGADICLNTPKVGWEACGTSWEKAVANWTLLCSTADGGPADIFYKDGFNKKNPPFFLIEEKDDDHLTANSLYENLEAMAQTLDDKHNWRKAVIRQLSAFLPIINGTRMMIEYLRLNIFQEA